jgi:hypothetical protein
VRGLRYFLRVLGHSNPLPLSPYLTLEPTRTQLPATSRRVSASCPAWAHESAAVGKIGSDAGCSECWQPIASAIPAAAARRRIIPHASGWDIGFSDSTLLLCPRAVRKSHPLRSSTMPAASQHRGVFSTTLRGKWRGLSRLRVYGQETSPPSRPSIIQSGFASTWPIIGNRPARDNSRGCGRVGSSWATGEKIRRVQRRRSKGQTLLVPHRLCRPARMTPDPTPIRRLVSFRR